MKRHLAILPMTLIIVSQGCKKDVKWMGGSSSAFIQRAYQFFEDSIRPLAPATDNYRAGQPRTLHWERAAEVILSIGKGVLVPVTYDRPLLVRTNFGGDHFYNLDNLVYVILYQDSGRSWRAQVVTSLPDSGYLTQPGSQFSGIKLVEDCQGNSIAKYRFDSRGIRKYSPSTKRAASFHVDEVCYEIAGYNYPSDDPADGYYWVEDAGCDLFYYGDDPGGGGLSGGDYGYPPGGGGSSSQDAPNTLVVMPGKNVITNTSEYFKCFTNGPGNSYTVTIYVDQPVPGSRTPWTFQDDNKKGGDVANVGHTFLTLTEVSGSTTITRNVGFYPGTSTFPGDGNVQGELDNDDVHRYSVGGSFTVDNSQFYSILNYVSQGNSPGYPYNLNSNNCTTFAMQALAKGGINLPSTIGIWPAGMGNDPGDLGEDLRIATIPGMTLITDRSLPHYNTGQCQQ